MSEMIGDIRLGRRASMALETLRPRQRALVRVMLELLGNLRRKGELVARLHRLDPDHPYYSARLTSDLRVIFRVEDGTIEATDLIRDEAVKSLTKHSREGGQPGGVTERSGDGEIRRQATRKALDRYRRRMTNHRPR